MKKHNSPGHYEGIIRVTTRRIGYVLDHDNHEIEIPEEHLHHALHGDRVRVKLLGRKGVGKITDIILRAKEDFVGELVREGVHFTIKPQDPKMYLPIEIPGSALKKANIGDKVVVHITHWKKHPEIPIGEIKEVIGKKGKHETEMRAIVIDKGFSLDYPEAANREAHAYKETYKELIAKEAPPAGKRQDFRGVPTFTIDPDDAKDFDDAISVRALSSDVVQIGVHIADASFFVREGGALDTEAARRGTSIYLVDRTIPMLPEVLSNNLCSLNPHEDKLTFSAVFEISKQGEIKNEWFGKTIIRSGHRFTYSEAQLVLDTQKGPYAKELALADEIALTLRAQRNEAGAITFEDAEVKFVLDPHGKPLKIYKKMRLETMKMIEDLMVLANSRVARYAETHDKSIEKTFVYRVHDLPSEDKMKELIHLMRVLGYQVPKKYKASHPRDVGKLLEKIDRDLHGHVLTLATVQSMAKAIYTTKNIGHFGLSLKHYTHFTSPIRRYADIMVHRLLLKILRGEKVPKGTWEKYEALSRYTSQMEILADEAQRASVKYKQVEYMIDHKNKTFDGSIVGFTEKGMFVREAETGTEGMVRFRDIPGDYYEFNDSLFAAIGKKKKKKYTIGDAVKIKIARINLDRRQIDFELT